MRRRDLLALSATALLAGPARAQTMRRVWRIGFLSGRARPVSLEGDAHGAFLEGMRDLGYREGVDFVTEWRFAGGDFGRLPALAAELVRANVDVIVTSPAIASRAARDATATVPVVFAYVSNPVASGLVQSLAKPGGNVTGLAVQQSDISPKQVELLVRAAPHIKRIAVLSNPMNEGSAVLRKSVNDAVESARLMVVALEATSAVEIDREIGRLNGEADIGLIGLPDPFFASERQRIAEVARQARVPTIFGEPDYTRAGGLMSYGDPLAKFIRRTAYYVDRILKGAAPADLPVEQPTQFHFAVNLSTARTLALDLPASLLVTADEVID